jgi:hypothetical protein
VTSLFERCGQALYGPRWQSALARDLEVSDRTVRRWVAGCDGVPDGVYAELLPLFDKRVAEISEVRELIVHRCPH